MRRPGTFLVALLLASCVPAQYVRLTQQPACSLAFIGGTTQYMPIRARVTVQAGGNERVQLEHVVIRYEESKPDGRWQAVSRGSHGGGPELVDAPTRTPLASNETRIFEVWLTKPAVLGWAGRYRLTMVIGVRPVVAPSEGVGVVKGVLATPIEIDMAPYEGPGANAMQQAREANGELWDLYRMMMDGGSPIPNLFRRVSKGDLQTANAWRQIAAAGANRPRDYATMVDEPLLSWANGAGGAVAYRYHMQRAGILLFAARSLADEIESLSAASLTTEAESLTQAAEAGLARAMQVAANPQDRLTVLVAQMRVAQLRGNITGYEALREAVRTHPDLERLCNLPSMEGVREALLR